MSHSLLQLIGNTPIIPLNALNSSACEVYVKLENKNPGGSIKDRIAIHMIDKALARKDIVAGGHIVEATSGNTGIALSMIAALYGLHCHISMPESMSIERQKLMRAYGAHLMLTPAKEGMAGANRAAEEFLQKNPDAFMVNQFSNEDAVEAHYLHTGPEIHAEFAHKGQIVDALVAGVGTGSTLTGCALSLREKFPQIRICAVEPEESPLLSTGKSAPHGIQGIGANFVPSILRRELIDEICLVSTEDALNTARALFQKEGISCGISSGANVCAALRLATQPHMQGKRIVTFICDTGERYLSTKLFDTE